MKKDIFDEKLLMEEAILEAKKSKLIGEVPVGALVVYDGEIIARGHNQTIKDNDPTSHAEINVIRKATIFLKNHRLVNASIVVTLEPCAMCYGAIVQSRIARLIFGAYDFKTGMCGSCHSLNQASCFNHKPEVIGGVLEKKCSRLLSNFFKERRL